MNTNLYSKVNNCAEWRIYKDANTAYRNESLDHFSLGLKNKDTIGCFGGTGACVSCYFISGNDCTIKPNTNYLMDLIKQLTDDNYISITPKSYPEYFI